MGENNRYKRNSGYVKRNKVKIFDTDIKLSLKRLGTNDCRAKLSETEAGNWNRRGVPDLRYTATDLFYYLYYLAFDEFTKITTGGKSFFKNIFTQIFSYVSNLNWNTFNLKN